MSVLNDASAQDIKTTYSSAEVCRLTGLTYRQMDYWVRTNILVPVVEAHGSGTHRRWAAEQVDDIYLAVALRRAGLSLDRVAEVLDKAHAIDAAALVLLDGEVIPVGEQGIAQAVDRLGGAAFVILRPARVPPEDFIT